MKVILWSLALTAYVSAASVPKTINNNIDVLDNGRIVGGDPATIEQFPYVVSLRKRYWKPEDPFKHWCGGSIYSDRLIITAAHCVMKTEANIWQVLAGTKYRDGKDGIIVPVEKIIINEHFTSVPKNNDIAILVLGVPLPLNNRTMKAIKLAESGPNPGEMATIAGWGYLKENGEFPDVLQEVNVPIVSNKVCNDIYNGRIFETMVCAGYIGVGGKSGCNGDSGGPLTVNGKLAGIVSLGKGCARPEFPEVFTRISYFLRWILEKASEFNGH